MMDYEVHHMVGQFGIKMEMVVVIRWFPICYCAFIMENLWIFCNSWLYRCLNADLMNYNEEATAR